MCGVPIDAPTTTSSASSASATGLRVRTDGRSRRKRRSAGQIRGPPRRGEITPGRSPRNGCSIRLGRTSSSPYPAAASPTPWTYGLAAVDISTGRFSVSETDGPGLPAEIARLDRVRSFARFHPGRSGARGALARRADRHHAAPPRRSRSRFCGAAAQGAFRRRDPRELRVLSRTEITAAGAALLYVERPRSDSVPSCNRRAGIRRGDPRDRRGHARTSS